MKSSPQPILRGSLETCPNIHDWQILANIDHLPLTCCRLLHLQEWLVVEGHGEEVGVYMTIH